MEKTELELKVSAEKSIHERLKKVIQQIWYDHNVCILEISIDWIDVSTPSEHEMLMTSIDMRSTIKV